MIIKAKDGTKYSVVAKVHKFNGKYKMQAYIERTIKSGYTDIVANQSFTFNMRKDADAQAVATRKSFVAIAKKYAR